jgi:hypothetical protein
LKHKLCARHSRAAGSHHVVFPCRDCPDDAKKYANYPDERGKNRLCSTHAYKAGTLAKPYPGASRIACE